ncbi:hypothetical protein JYU34_017098 [Plutella xylostella]|uniref:Uncharacterized protein n=1 Tax=Plutella xylostella TaxID=51655 RepID=A0ABQ7Q0C8_PLUXY|nr:hypothetical protein JYU34_017098 [Plutella xylostella]
MYTAEYVSPPSHEGFWSNLNVHKCCILRLRSESNLSDCKQIPVPRRMQIPGGLGGVTVFPATPAPPGLGEAVALISCGGLPAADDQPLLTTRVGALGPLALEALGDAGITEVYATWSLGPHVFTTPRAPVPAGPGEGEGVIDLQYARALPLSRDQDTATLLGTLQDSSVQVQLRGIRKIEDPVKAPQLFGRRDRSFPDSHLPLLSPEPSDVIIAVCSVDASSLARGDNAVVRGEYFLNPPIIDDSLHQAALCTNANDVNGIKAPALAVPAHIILEAQMTLEVSIAFVGCKPPQLTGGFSRFFCLSKDSNAIISLGLKMKEINTKLAAEDKEDQLLTGFVCCTGRAYFMFLEGPKDGEILQIWTITEEHRERIQTFFSTDATYTTRIYPDLMTSSMPVIMVQLSAPLQALAACPAPTPLTRAVLKLSRLVSSRLHTAPAAAALPSAADLRALGLETTAP